MLIGQCAEVKITVEVTASGLSGTWPEHSAPANFFRCEAYVIIPILRMEKLRQERAKYQTYCLVWDVSVVDTQHNLEHPEFTPT